ncbi:MAG: hypothetical protein QM490_02770 [Candidatus Gracilibacteria bacterium]
MPNVVNNEKKKIKVGMPPNLQFEVFIGTFLDKSKYEIVPLNVVDHKAVSKYAQNIHGEWCFPIKLHIAMYEKAIVEQGVEKIIAIVVNICSYPFLIANLNKIIKKKFDFHPLFFKKTCVHSSFIIQAYKQIKKLDPNYNFIKYLSKIPLAWRKRKVSYEIIQLYYNNLPKSKNSVLLKKEFNKFRNSFINTESLKLSKISVQKFKDFIKNNGTNNKIKFDILVSGDLTLNLGDFTLFDLDIYFAKKGIRLVNPILDMNLCIIRKFSKHLRKSKKLLNNMFTSKNSNINVDINHSIEIDTFTHIFKGIAKGTDGIIFAKPNMCSPSEHVSYILKQNNYFNLPFVELTYDEHSGLNGIMTRLEAFINILEDRKNNK